MPFPIPPSFVEYATRPEVRTVVDHILSKKNPEIPSCLAWIELPAFYKAVLSAHQVRCEFAVLLYDLWEEIWRTAWNQTDFGEERGELSVVDAQKWQIQSLDPNAVWDARWFGGVFTVAFAGSDFEVGVGVVIDHQCRVHLSLDAYGPDSSRITTELLSCSRYWPVGNLDGNYAWTDEDLLRIDGPGIEPGELRSAAAQAVESFRNYVQQ